MGEEGVLVVLLLLIDRLLLLFNVEPFGLSDGEDVDDDDELFKKTLGELGLEEVIDMAPADELLFRVLLTN